MTEIFDSIKKEGEIEINPEKNEEQRLLWQGVSKHAIDFIKKTLVKNEANRYNAQRALEHPWMKNVSNIVLDEITLENLRKRLKVISLRYNIKNI